MNEIWKPIPGYERWYEISNTGNVKSFKVHSKGKLLSKTDIGGYHYTSLHRDGCSKQLSIHYLVAITFIGKKPTPTHQINHKNGNKHDNSQENLEWVTIQENVKHQIENGLRGKSFKLNSEKVRAIRNKYANGSKQHELAKEYSVTQSNISSIVKKKSWANL